MRMELQEVPGLDLKRRHSTLNPMPWQLDKDPAGPDAAATTANRLDFFAGTSSVLLCTKAVELGPCQGIVA